MQHRIWTEPLKILAISLVVMGSVIGLCALLIFAFLFFNLVSFVEVERASSPDGKYDAIVVEGNGGATTDFGYTIYLVPAKQSYWRFDPEFSWLPGHSIAEVGYLYGASRSPTAYGVNLHWESSNKLVVEYYECRRGSVLKSVTFDHQKFEISEKHALDWHALPGGMEYNINQKR